MPRIVRFEGKTQQFPDDATDDEIRAALEGQSQAGEFGKLEQARSGFYARKAASALGDVGIGALKGAGQNVATISRGLNKIPYIGETLAPSSGVQRFEEITTPQGTAQTVGAGLEQAAELMLPGGAITKGVRAAGALGKGARLAARVGLEGAATGANAAMHGQDPVTGAIAGAAGAGVGEGMRALAPGMAESSLGIRLQDRLRGKRPGEAALSQTKAIRPAIVTEQAQAKLDELNNALTVAANQSTQRGSANSAIGVIDRALAEAKAQNNAGNYKKLLAVKQQLTTNFDTGQPLNATTAKQLLDLRRGVDDLVTTWNPQDTSKSVQGVIKQVRHTLGEEVHALAPGTRAIDEQISSLIPVAKRGEETAAKAGIGQNVFGRLAAHTGAAAVPVAAGVYGYREGGLPTAVAYGVGGAVGQEAAVAPATRMLLARLAASPVMNKAVIRLGQGIGLQAIGQDKDGNVIMRPVPSED